MKYKFELSIMIAMLFGLLLTGVASADSVIKTLYVDGAKVGTSTTTQAISFPYPRLTIGSEGNRWYQQDGLVGEIDEFAVYGKILNDANVAEHYNAGTGSYRAKVNADSPLLYLQFEDGSTIEGNKAANSGSADMNSTYIGAVGQDATGYIGKAAIFHGSNGGAGDCVDVCDYSQTLSLVDVSVEFWVKTTQSSGYPRFFQHNGDTLEKRSYGAMYSAETNAIGLIGGGSTGYLNSVINNGEWHHIVVTFHSIKPGPYAAEVMDDAPCVYLKFDNLLLVDSSENHWWVGNGQKAKVQKTAGGMGNSLYEDNTLMVGDTPHADGDAFTWNNWADPPGRTRNGPPYGGHNDNYAFTPSDITFEIWIKTVPGLSPDAYAIIFQQKGHFSYGPNAPELAVYHDVNGVPWMRVAGGSQWWYPGVQAPFDGEWHQLVVTYDENEVHPGRDMGIQLYLDGSLAGSTTIVDDVNLQALLGPEQSTIQIGSEGDFGYPYNCYSGYVDEFAVYPGVLSPDRIAAHYAAWQPKDCAEVKARGMTLPGDFNGDCQVDFYDYAIFASEWRLCDNPGGSGCSPNW
jgi:hypothetical protein